MNKSLKVTFLIPSFVFLLTSTAVAQTTVNQSKNERANRFQETQKVDQSQRLVQPTANETHKNESGDKVVVHSATLGICYEAELTCGEGGVEPEDYGQ